MKILFLGGTVFLGRALVEAALERGHELTLFNRGQHGADLFPEVEKLRGNRDGELDVLQGREWDAVIDTCGYVPRIVRASAEALANSVKHYTFISSISAFADFTKPGLDESAAVGTMSDPTVETITGETYGPLKALCEQAAEETMPGRVLVVRPGLIVGPHDPTDRFTYWPHRVAQGGEILAPGDGGTPVQFIDVRDLAEWTIRMVETNHTGIYNATGPDYVLSMDRFLQECQTVIDPNARFTWVPEKFLLEQGVSPWVQLPLWIPAEGEMAAMQQVNVSKALGAGLTFRPVAQTIADTLAWDNLRPSETALKAGLAPEREAEVLQAWHTQS